MDLNVDSNNDLLDRFFYVKSLPSDDHSLCVACQCDEEPLEGGRMWEGYVLKCGHTYHSFTVPSHVAREEWRMFVHSMMIDGCKKYSRFFF
jgi:hypothetical protein